MNEPIKIRKLVKGHKVPVLFKYMSMGTITVKIERRNKAGALIYPYVYQINAFDISVERYDWISRGGWPGYAVPLGAFRKIAKRVELCLPSQ